MSESSHIEDFLIERYYHGGEDFSDLAYRVSSSLADDQEEEYEFYTMIMKKTALPSSPILMNAGLRGFMSACSFLPIEDDMWSIMQTISKAVMIQKAGGGTGFNFSKLRPKGSRVSTTNGVASGPCSFIHMYDACSDVIKQGGRRRGANMGLLCYDHKDIDEFIHLKDNKGLSNFNLSVILDDNALRDYKDIIEETAQQIWKHGEPGVVFWDRILKDEPKAAGINPCGEIPLRPYESCVLGSMNLYVHLQDDDLDYDGLAATTTIMTKLLNRVIDKNNYPFPEMKEAAQETRKIGLGIMGFADTLFRLGITYGSDDCMKMIDRIMGTVKTAAQKASDGNQGLISIAPTGSISMIAGVSSGIEPVFALSYKVNRDSGEMNILDRALQDMKLNVNSLPPHILTAQEIAPIKHIKVQAHFQKWVDQAISKTINLPNSTTVDDIEKLIYVAHRLKCKGLTMFRDGCQREAFLTEIKCPSCSV